MAEAPGTSGKIHPDELLDRLIDDAKLVASFGQRAGVFQDSALFSAIQSVESDDGADWGSKNVVALQASLNSAIKAITPVTLVDLRAGWDPFYPDAPLAKIMSFLRFGYVILAVLLIVSAVHYTQWLKRAEAVIIVQEQDLAGQLDQMIHSINDDFLNTEVGSGSGLGDLTTGPARAALREKLREAQRLSSARWDAHREYNVVNSRFYVLWGVALYGEFDRLWGDYKKFRQQAMVVSTAPPRIANANPCGDLATTDEASAATGSAGQAAAAENVSGPAVVMNPSGDLTPVSQLNQRVSEDEIGLRVLRCLVGADLAVTGVNYDDAELKQKIETVALWLLPALFGAFGAVVYHLRACWNRLRPDPRLGRAMLRVFLGAFGGIAFGWFWAPTVPKRFSAADLATGCIRLRISDRLFDRHILCVP
jgi:hypothetical protein